MMSFLNLIRWKNLLLIVLVQLLIKYALLEPLGVNTALHTMGTIILVLATICIAAAGNVINDIYDVDTDLINKPKKVIINKTISEKTAFSLFIGLNLVGVGLGFYLSNLVGKSAFFSVFVVTSALLYIYASYLKQLAIVGNIIISVLVALSVLIVGIFDLLPNLTPDNQSIQLGIFKIIFRYGIFAFMINLLREIVKDLEDYEGDFETGIRTLPIITGKKTTTYCLFALTIVVIISIIYYIFNTLYKNQITTIYFLIFIVGPLILLSIKTLNARNKKDFSSISNGFKWVMLFGMLSLLL